MLQKINKRGKVLKILNISADEHSVRKFARKDKPFTMGMAASQGRLLFMTARISNNEFEQQCVAYSKQRLADDSQQANDQYLEALQATQYQILTGYNGDSPTYEPVTYNQITNMNAVATRKQYIVSDNKNQIVVTKQIADAFSDAHYDFNRFLKNVGGLTQVEKSYVTEGDVHDAWDKYFASINKGHADGIYYDKTSNLQGKHVLGFAFHESKPKNGSSYLTNADSIIYATFNTASVTGTYTIGEESYHNQIFLQEGIESDGSPYYYYGNTPVEIESYLQEDGTTGYRAKYMANRYLISSRIAENMMDDDGYVYINNVEITDSGKLKYNGEEYTELFVDQNFGNPYEPNLTKDQTTKYSGVVSNGEQTIFYEGSTAEQRDLYDYAMAVTEKYATGNKLEYDSDKVQYYKNIYQEMITKGYTTFDKMLEEKYINTITYDNGGSTLEVADERQAYMNENWLINQLKSGKLSISYYSVTDEQFIKTTLDDDESIVQKENKAKMAIAEQVYQNHMDKIESEDKRFDMQLTKLESEHTALTTEYESVAKVISKNVEKSFNIFNA